MFITELHGEMNVVTFCYIAASIVFLQCYSSTINQSTVQLIKKIEIIQTAVMLIQNDVQAVAPDGTLYPIVANMLSAGWYTYLKFLDPSFRQWLWEAWGNEQHLLANNAVHESTGIALSTADWPYFSATPYSCHFGSRYFNIVTTEAKILQLLQRVLQLPRVLSSSNLLLIMLTQFKDTGWPKHIPWTG